MPSPRACVFAVGPTNVVTTAETAIGTVGPVNVNAPVGQGILVEGTFNFTAGTAATAVTVRIRAGAGTGGAILATHTFTVVAGTQYSLSANYLDPSIIGAGATTATYTVTVQQTAATGNGTVNNATVAAEECVGQW